MPFGLCNAPAIFQRCMLAIFHDMIEESIEVFMDDFSVFGNSFDTCLNNLYKMLQRCKDAHLVLNWEKCHFMVKEGIMLGHKFKSAEVLETYSCIRLDLTSAEFDIEIKDKKERTLMEIEYQRNLGSQIFANSSRKETTPHFVHWSPRTYRVDIMNPITAKKVLDSGCFLAIRSSKKTHT
ncbi:reverse transcriptase domain-containing protein [Tanacetum coccineum]